MRTLTSEFISLLENMSDRIVELERRVEVLESLNGIEPTGVLSASSLSTNSLATTGVDILADMPRLQRKGRKKDA